MRLFFKRVDYRLDLLNQQNVGQICYKWQVDTIGDELIRLSKILDDSPPKVNSP